MTATVPVPIEFLLPPAWASAAADQVDASGVAYAALRTGADGFRPNITVTVQDLGDDVTLLAVADELLAHLREVTPGAELVSRTVVESDDVPGVAQLVGLAVTIDGTQIELVQVHALMLFKDEKESSRRMTYLFTLTVAREDLDLVLPEFQSYVASVRVAA